MALNALDFVIEHIPSFIDTSAYRGFAKALEPEAIEKQMWVNYGQMMEDETGELTQAIAYDPLNLRGVVLGEVLQSVSTGYNIIDGHLFCPDSTVALAYLAPAFKSLDSKASTEFSRMLSKAQMEFEADAAAPSVAASGIDVERGGYLVAVERTVITHAIDRQHHFVVVAQRYPCGRRVGRHLQFVAEQPFLLFLGLFSEQEIV